MNTVDLAESGWLPDALLRAGIRRLLNRRLVESVPRRAQDVALANHALREVLSAGPIALVPELANEQHYEMPPAFFERVLGRHLKYSCGLFEAGVTGLDDAERRMLARTCERAQVEDGMSLLDLGCGWGALSLYLAERFPRSRVLAFSNSKSQREYILGRCERSGLQNVEVMTADVNHFEPARRFDRVISVEMFEHVRNAALLLERIAGWLEPTGSLFVHHFSHRSAAYPYEDESGDDWMARHFFSGGIMPSHDWLLFHQEHLRVERQWVVDGTHYQRTAEAWLARQDAQRDEILQILSEVRGAEQAPLCFQRWRLFFLACAELFGFRDGQEWWVTHTRMVPRTVR
jgi:cyclopropane-fatty-acyl-phospholipid synthase